MCILHETHWLSGEIADVDIERCNAFYENSMCNTQLVKRHTLPRARRGHSANSQEELAKIRAGLQADRAYTFIYPWLWLRSDVEEEPNEAAAEEPKEAVEEEPNEAVEQPKKVVSEKNWVRAALEDVTYRKGADDGKEESGEEDGKAAFDKQREQSVKRWDKKRLLTPPKTP